MSKILVVDDEQDIVDLITLHLGKEGHEAIAVYNGLQVVPWALEHEPDLIVLDIMMPGLNGVQVFKRLRMNPQTRTIPVVMLTARAQMADKIAGLELGADDYLTKPFSPRELMLRISAVLRRTKKVTSVAETRVGNFKLDRKNMMLFVKDQAVDLTLTEFKLLAELMETPGEIYSRSDLLSAVWGYTDDTQSRTLDTHIKRLREKLGEYGNHISTARGLGYRFDMEPRAE